ncbi:hypothetical protein B296_00058801 [Ensete ventricosum]|uniref:Uncharacterized protein n=1 Tax=Ensete ventricosum TaxID=4639 RepID=A0A426XKH7_ENSVE|nr:hypothetical protein B296_00058801 [Ensete ventricosum]
MVPLSCQVAPNALTIWALRLIPKNVVKLYIIAEESARLGSVRVCKLIRIGREETRKPERGPSGLGCVSWDALAGCASRDAVAQWLLRGPARRPSRGRVGSRGDPSDDQVSSVVDFAIPLLRRGSGAFIATVIGYPFLNPLSSLLLTIPLHLTIIVCGPCGEACLSLSDVDLAHLTCVSSAV